MLDIFELGKETYAENVEIPKLKLCNFCKLLWGKMFSIQTDADMVSGWDTIKHLPVVSYPDDMMIDMMIPFPQPCINFMWLRTSDLRAYTFKKKLQSLKEICCCCM